MSTRNMYDLQRKNIYDPIINYLVERMKTHMLNDTAKIVQVSTSGGKTWTTIHFVIPTLIKMGIDVIYTNPNASGVEEVYRGVCEVKKEQNLDSLNWHEKSFTGSNVEMPYLKENQYMVLCCHPTVISQNLSVFQNFSLRRNIVIISDEAHKGLNCTGEDDTLDAFGVNIPGYESVWFDSISRIRKVGWIMLTATPLLPTYTSPENFEIISSCLDRKNHALNQKRVKNVTFYNYSSNSGLIGNKSMRKKAAQKLSNSDWISLTDDELLKYNVGSDIELLKKLQQKMRDNRKWVKESIKTYNLPLAKPSTIIQVCYTDDAISLQKALSEDGGNKPAIVTAKVKGISEFTKANNINEFGNNSPSSNQIIEYVDNPNNEHTVLIANKIVGESVNLVSATTLISDHTRVSRTKDWVTAAVRQLIGRMLRWPNVGDLKNWDDVLEYKSLRISQGVPKEVMEKWIDLVFCYEVHMSYSPANVFGVSKFFEELTFNPEEWVNFIQKKENKIEKGHKKRYGIKTPWEQKGSQEYKMYRINNPSCEHCSKNKFGVPFCEDNLLKTFTLEEIHDCNQVHHINGDHSDPRPENLLTVCPYAHHKISIEENHYHNEKYRLKVV